MATWTDRVGVGRVLYAFKADGAFQISLNAGDRVEIQKESSGWFKGKVIGRDSKGIFPVSYIEFEPDNAAPPPPASEPPPIVQPAAQNPIADKFPPQTAAASANSSVSTGAVAGAVASASAGSVRKWPPPIASSSSTPIVNSSSSVNPVFPPKPADSGSSSSAMNRAPVKMAGIPPSLPPAAVQPLPVKQISVNTGNDKASAPMPIMNSTSNSSNASLNNSRFPTSPISSPPGSEPTSPTASRFLPTKPPPAPVNPVNPAPASTIRGSDAPPPIPSKFGAPPNVRVGPPAVAPVPFKPNESNQTPAIPQLPAPANLLQNSPPVVPPLPSASSAVAPPAPRYPTSRDATAIPVKPVHRGLNTFAYSLDFKADQLHIESGRESKLKENISIEALQGEIELTTKEWNKSLNEALKIGNAADYGRQMERLSSLLELRRRLMNNDEFKQSDKEREEVRHEIIELIESSRKLQEGFMVPRNAQGAVADTGNTPIIELLKLHRVMYSSLKEESSHLWMQKAIERQERGMKNSLKASGAQTTIAASGSMLPKFPTGQLQLLLDIKMCIFSVGEACDLYFSLYSAGEGKFLTEDFSLSLTETGMPGSMRLIGKMHTLFGELEDKDFASDLWLVVKIYRMGRLILDPKEKKPPPKLTKRPWGCSAMSLTFSGLNDAPLGQEFQPPNSSMTIFTFRDESQFTKMHELIIKGSKEVEPAPKAKGIALGFTLYQGELESVRKANQAKLMIDECPVTRKLYFPDFMTASDTRNDFYVHILSGLFVQDGGKTSARNIEVSIRCVRQDGVLIENCITNGAANTNQPQIKESEYRSAVYYHNNSPVFDERICLHIPLDTLLKSHLLFTFWHISKNAKNSAPFAFGWLPLATDLGAILEDGEWKVLCYKPLNENTNPANKLFNSSYLKPGKDLSARKDVFSVRTLLLSTTQTQNNTLHSLFQWRTTDLGALNVQLYNFTLINKSSLAELAKFARETFDVFFAILTSPAHSLTHENTFNAFLHMLSLFTDKKLPQFKQLIDGYIMELFNVPGVHTILILRSVQLLNSALTLASGSGSTNLVKLAKSFPYVVKFIAASRSIDQKNSAFNENQFKTNFMNMLQSINGVLKVKEDATGAPASNAEASSAILLSCQSYLIRSFHECVADLHLFFNLTELASVIKTFIFSIPGATGANSKASAYQVDKLNLIRNLLTNEFLLSPEVQSALYPVVVQTLIQHFRSVDTLASSGNNLSEIYLCVAILMNLLQATQSRLFIAASESEANGVATREKFLTEFLPLVEPLVHVVFMIKQSAAGEIQLKPPSDSVIATCKLDLLVDSLTCLFTVLQTFLSPQNSLEFSVADKSGPLKFDLLLDGFGTEQIKKFLIELMSVLKHALNSALYPDMWIVLTMLQFAIAARVLLKLNPIVKKKLMSVVIPTVEIGVSFSSIFSLYFELFVTLLTSSALNLESFSLRKLQFITSRYGDIRDLLTSELHIFWRNLGSQRLTFLDKLIPHIIQLILASHSDTQLAGIDLFYDILKTEFQSNTIGQNSSAQRGIRPGESENIDYFSGVERHTIDQLYHLANKSQETGNKLMELIRKHLQSRIDTDHDAANKVFNQSAAAFLQRLSKLWELMSSLMKYPDTSVFEEERTSIALQLINYLESSGYGAVRKEMFNRYVQFLVDLHLPLSNFVEAGFAQLQIIRLLDWSDQQLTALNEFYPQESERDRKEKMYLQAIKYFTDGEDYEDAISCIEELRHFYQFTVCNYTKLAQLLTSEAELFKLIVRSERFYSNYFRVCYFGDFEPDIRDKEFVYRGCKLEPIMDFCGRIKKKYPEAKLFMSSDKPAPDQFAESKQIISVTTLTKCTDLEKRQHESFIKGLQPSTLQFLHSKLNEQHRRNASQVPPIDFGPPISLYKLNHQFTPPAVVKHRENSDLRVFSYSKAIQKSADKKPANEFKELWVNKTYIFCDDSFPTNRRRCEIIDKTEILLSPLENALSAIVNKNIELREKIDQVQNSPPGPVDVGPLSMNLNGMIDAAVNGGTQKYIEAFLLGAENENAPDPNYRAQRIELKNALKNQIIHLKAGLEVFGTRCDPKLKGLFDHLQSFYEDMVKKLTPVLQ